MGRYAALLLLLIAVPACSAPTPTAPPLHPVNTSLTGRVIDDATLTGINGAVVRIIGPNVDRVATTDGAGNYSFIYLFPAVFTVLADAPLHYEQTKSVDLTTSNTLSFERIGGAPATPSPWDY